MNQIGQGGLLAQQRYKPFGAVRENIPQPIPNSPITQTDFGYTGQRDMPGMGLMDYKARAYDPLLMRFIQPDTIIPNPADPQGWNRLSYVRNNPMRFTDPTGHYIVEDEDCTQLSCSGDPDPGQVKRHRREKDEADRMAAYVEQLMQLCLSSSGAAGCPPAPPTTIRPWIYGPGSQPLVPYATTPQDLVWYGRYMNNMWELVDDLGISTVMVRKSFIWGRAINPNPAIDFTLGAAGQAINDTALDNLSMKQRAGRSLAVGIESVVTGVASDVAGAIGFVAGEAVVPEGGGIVGYPLFAVTASIYLDEVVWADVNQRNFMGWGLGMSP